MTANNSKHARRIPDEGLFTIHFVNVGNAKLTFDVQITSMAPKHLVRAVRTRSQVPAADLSFRYPAQSLPGRIYAGDRQIGTFTITPPTLKGDPDEPT